MDTISYIVQENDELSSSHLKVLVFENTGNPNSLSQDVS